MGAFGHDAVAGLETTGNDPIRTDLIPDFDVLQPHGIRFVQDRHLIAALQLGHGPLRHEQGVRDRMRLGTHPRILARAQQVIGVGKKADDLQRAGVGIDLPVGEEKPSRLRVNRAVGKKQLQFEIGLGAAARRVVPPEIEIRLFADLKINLDRIKGRNGREHAARLSHQIADLRLRHARQTIHRRSDAGEIEIQLRAFQRGFVRFNLRFGRQIRLQGVVQFLLADGLFLRERRVALHVQFRLSQLRLVLRQLGLRLVQGGLEGARVNLEQPIALFYPAAFGVILRQ